MMILPQTVADYLSTHHVATLATHGEQGPWAAAVFYARDNASLIFLSSPNSRHCLNLAQNPRCAATIQEDYHDWRAIKGIQMEGQVRQLHDEEERDAQQLYQKKFPFINPLGNVAPQILKAVARVRWFRLEPECFYFIDNSKGFGHRDVIDLARD